jgi:predicted dehydrogenase
MRAAVIGLGFVGRAHLEGLRRLGIAIPGVLDDPPSRTQEVAKSLGIPRAYSSLDDLLSDKDVDAVHICTPNFVHAEQTMKSMKAGKHVVCEKPLAMNSKETASIVEAAKNSKVCGAVNYNLRYYPLCQEARTLVQKGVIGEPRLVHGSYLQDWLTFPSDWNWRLEPQFGGTSRCVADIGTHWMDMVTWITGRRITELCADLATLVPVRQKPRGVVESFQERKGNDYDEIKITTEDCASVLFRFEGNMRGMMTVSQISPGRKNRLWYEIDGSEGSLAWNGEEPNVLWIGERKKANHSMIKDPSIMSPEARGYAGYPGGHAEGYPDTFVQLFKEFYAYVAAGNYSAPKPFPTFENGHHEVQLCEIIADSAKDRKWVSVPGK